MRWDKMRRKEAGMTRFRKGCRSSGTRKKSFLILAFTPNMGTKGGRACVKKGMCGTLKPLEAWNSHIEMKKTTCFFHLSSRYFWWQSAQLWPKQASKTMTWSHKLPATIVSTSHSFHARQCRHVEEWKDGCRWEEGRRDLPNDITRKKHFQGLLQP